MTDRPSRRRVGVAAATAWLLLATTVAPAATLLVVAPADDRVHLLDARDGTLRASLPTGPAPREVAVRGDGALAVVSGRGVPPAMRSTLTVVDVAAGAVRGIVELESGQRLNGVAWIGEARVVVTAEGSARLLIVDVERNVAVAAIDTGHRLSHAVAVSPDGRRAFVPSVVAGVVTVIDLVEHRVERDVRSGRGAAAAAVTPDGARLWVANRRDDTVTVIDAKTLEPVATRPTSRRPTRLVVTPDGGRVTVASGEGGVVSFLDEATRRPLGRLELPDGEAPGGLAFAPNGSLLWIAVPDRRAVLTVDVETLAVVESTAIPGAPLGLAFSPVSVRRR